MLQERLRAAEVDKLTSRYNEAMREHAALQRSLDDARHTIARQIQQIDELNQENGVGASAAAPTKVDIGCQTDDVTFVDTVRPPSPSLKRKIKRKLKGAMLTCEWLQRCDFFLSTLFGSGHNVIGIVWLCARASDGRTAVREVRAPTVHVLRAAND